jgi:hypothetical protein
MTEPTTVYLVTRGVYADYQVLGVFTERCGAQEFADHHNLTTERYTTDDRAPRSRRSTCTPGLAQTAGWGARRRDREHDQRRLRDRGVT